MCTHIGNCPLICSGTNGNALAGGEFIKYVLFLTLHQISTCQSMPSM